MSVDGYMNISLEKTEEYVDGKLRRSYGEAFVRGNNGSALLQKFIGAFPLISPQCCISRPRESMIAFCLQLFHPMARCYRLLEVEVLVQPYYFTRELGPRQRDVQSQPLFIHHFSMALPESQLSRQSKCVRAIPTLHFHSSGHLPLLLLPKPSSSCSSHEVSFET